MSWKSGLNSNAKKLLIKLPEEQGEDELYSLNRAQIKALLAVGESIAWRTRHIALPSYITNQDELSAFADETLKDLMMPVDLCALLENCTDELKQIILDLLANDNDVKQQIIDMLVSNQEFITNINNQNQPFPVSPVGQADTLGKLWAQCVFIVEFTDLRLRDMFEIIEVQFNNLEFLTFVEAIPIIGTLMDEVQIDVALDFINYVQEIWKELYEANWTEDPPDGLGNMGTKWVLACALFCLCRDDKTITITRIVEAFQSCIEDGFLTLDSIGELAETFIGVNDNNPNLVYLSFTFVWGVAKLASVFTTSRVTSQMVSTMLKLAENDANNDYAIYCEDCATPTPDREAVIDSLWDEPNIAGSIVGPDENGYYTVTAESRGTDYAFCIMDIDQRRFKLTDITYSYPPTCQVIIDGATMIYIGCNGANNYADYTIDEFWSTWNNTLGAQTMTFKIVAP